MKQIFAIGTTIAALTACTQPQVPDSGAGVGFNDYAQYELERAQREAALTGAGTATFGAPTPVASGPINSNAAIPSSALAQAGIGTQQPAATAPLSALNPQATLPNTVRSGGLAIEAPATGALDPNLANNPNISDEQSFDAVASRETIESDAQRRAAQAAELVVVAPVPLPAQRADTGVNIVQYALNAPNVRGQEWYSRSILSGDTRFQRNCATYNNPDEAQRDFLSRGGPDRDPRGIDPDGDGFACGWDPAPFKLAAGN